MYGMVNKAVEEMVTTRFGEETWERIRARAGIDVEVFISNEGYPDDVTYGLVAAASEELGLKPEEILEEFGGHWILHTARDGYGDLLDAAGATLPEFLVNLPSFHTRVTLMYPKLLPPEFTVTDLRPGSLHLHYRSHRPGLKPFVVGLLKGLGVMFGVAVTIGIVTDRDHGADHDEFLVKWNTTPSP